VTLPVKDPFLQIRVYVIHLDLSVPGKLRCYPQS
jgi:hypothetical protein